MKTALNVLIGVSLFTVIITPDIRYRFAFSFLLIYWLMLRIAREGIQK